MQCELGNLFICRMYGYIILNILFGAPFTVCKLFTSANTYMLIKRLLKENIICLSLIISRKDLQQYCCQYDIKATCLVEQQFCKKKKYRTFNSLGKLILFTYRPSLHRYLLWDINHEMKLWTKFNKPV